MKGGLRCLLPVLVGRWGKRNYRPALLLTVLQAQESSLGILNVPGDTVSITENCEVHSS